jgi:hypothetical protein
VAINHRERSADLALDGTVLIGTDRGRDGEHVAGSIRLRGWEAVVVDAGP